MLSSKKLKYLRSLHLRKFRQKYHNFIVEGEKICQEVLLDDEMQVEAVFGENGWISENEALLRPIAGQVEELTSAEMKKVSLLSTPNKVLMVVNQPDLKVDSDEVKSDISLYLDDIRDPGNLGTILRIADWFGIRYVFRSENSVELFNPKVVQSSMGAFLRVKSPKMDFETLKNDFSKLPILGTVLDGESIFELDLPNAAIIVIGNESRGISRELLPMLTRGIAIPRAEGGGAESLNAAVATGIMCAVFRNSTG